MKRLLTILFLLPFIVKGQQPKWILTVWEYTTPAIDSFGLGIAGTTSGLADAVFATTVTGNTSAWIHFTYTIRL